MDYGIPLAKFKEPTPITIFPIAEEPLPQFLNENLLDDDRQIRYFFKDPQASLRVFYYQYLKLCFEMQEIDYELYINKIEELLTNQNFHFVFPEGKNSELYNDFQFKRLIIEFMEVLDDDELSVEAALGQYPIMN